MTEPLHLQFWPPGAPAQLPAVRHTLDDNLRRGAQRAPDHAALVFYGAVKTYASLNAEVSHIAGYLQQTCGVAKGMRVGLLMQNSPQFVAGYYGIIRAGGVVVPINAMNRTDELRYLLGDAGIRTVLTAQDLVPQLLPLMQEQHLDHVIAAHYAAELPQPAPEGVPELVSAQKLPLPAGVTPWEKMLEAASAPAAVMLTSTDLCVQPYTSGSTGRGKGCLHTHATTLHAVGCVTEWFGLGPGDVFLGAAPMFHVVGMQAGMNAAIAQGGTLVLLPRWDREVAARLIRDFGVSVWPTVPTAVIDFLNRPSLAPDDLSTLRLIFGGGSAMPQAVAKKLQALTGLRFVECYGMTETIAPALSNPPQRPKDQCAGVPVFNTDVLILHPDTQTPLPQGEVGEIAVSGPQVMQGYWQNPQADAETFVTIAGRRYLRTGDLGSQDAEGYIFIADRLKRMINVSGYKVWPAEVETRLYQHPAIANACIIRAQDPYRGETVKAVVVLKPGHQLTAETLAHWCQAHMAAYKIPRLLQVVDALPTSGAGKVLWRELQDAQDARDTQDASQQVSA